MSFREIIGKYQKATAVLAVLVALGAIAYIVHGMTARPSTMAGDAFFTIDDGKTVFSDDANRLAPFDHNGQPAYRVWMFTSDNGATKFPGYLERLTPEAKRRIEAQLLESKSGASRTPPSITSHDIEVKKPGAGNPWVSRADPASVKITTITGPNGPLEIVMP